jgi:N-acetylmuramoyl-L-alanine amidase
MNSKDAPEKYARGIYNAFIAYKKKYHAGGANAPLAQVPQPEASQAPQETKPQKRQETTPQETKAESKRQEPQPEQKPKAAQESISDTDRPVFKVQILTSDQLLKPGDKRLKGQTKVDRYKDGKIWKYTVGCSEDYSEILRLRRQLASLFPKAFIVAFRGDQRMDKDEAVREYQRNKRKK